MYVNCVFILYLFVRCLRTDCYHITPKMEQYMKVLDITDEDFVHNCDHLEKDSDLEHTLGLVGELNIVQSNIRGLIGKQSSVIQETKTENPNIQIDIYILCEA